MADAADPANEAFLLSAALYAECRVVDEFTSSFVRGRIAPPEELGEPERLIVRQFLRIDAWLRTLAKLNAPGDFQAVSSGCRSLMEVAVDIVLLSADKSVFQKILDWEESAKLKHAQALKLFYDKKGSDMTTDHPQVAAFIARSATKIEGLRQQHGRKKNGKGAMEVASE